MCVQLRFFRARNRLLSGLALDAAGTRAKIPTGPARKSGERAAVINSDITEVRRIPNIAVNGSELAVAGGSKVASRVDHARQCWRRKASSTHDPPAPDSATTAS